MIVADQVIGLLGGILNKFPDGNERKEAEAAIRSAVVAANSTWGPQGIVGLASGLSLVFYLSILAFGEIFGVQPVFKLDILTVQTIFTAAFFKLDHIDDLIKWLKEWNKRREEKKK